ncbi:hypothetical protein HD806DRAFT_540297 [Xylariaceae sp. AK1471]|nr:hypothetical protein HD806DRAFT_540297 [Xylariaceae sp. AK1471]
MTNLGPLTTTFTPSGADCSSTFIAYVYRNEWLQYGVGGAASSACLPTNFNPYESHYYSPGLCPSGYTSACSAEVSFSTRSALETEATCCPSAYLCHEDRSDDPFGCWSCFIEPRTFAASAFFFSTDSAGVTTKISFGTTTEVWSTNCIRAYGPIVRRVAGDISSVTSSTSSSPTDSRSDYSTATATAPAAIGGDRKAAGGLSTGAAAGIGVGSGLAAFLLIGTTVVLFRRRRRRLRVHGEPIRTEQTSQVHGNNKSERGCMPWSEYYQHQHQQQQQEEPLAHELNAAREYAYELNAERD